MGKCRCLATRSPAALSRRTIDGSDIDGELRVLIAYDSEFMRVAYKRIIEDQSSMQVVAMASNGAKAVWSAAET